MPHSNKNEKDKKQGENTKDHKESIIDDIIQELDTLEEKDKNKEKTTTDELIEPEESELLSEESDQEIIQSEELKEPKEPKEFDISSIDISSFDQPELEEEGLLKEDETEEKIVEELEVVKRPLKQRIIKHFASYSLKKAIIVIFLTITLLFSSIAWVLNTETENNLNRGFNYLNEGLIDLNNKNIASATSDFLLAQKYFSRTTTPAALSKIFNLGNLPLVAVGVLDQETIAYNFYLDDTVIFLYGVNLSSKGLL